MSQSVPQTNVKVEDVPIAVAAPREEQPSASAQPQQKVVIVTDGDEKKQPRGFKFSPRCIVLTLFLVVVAILAAYMIIMVTQLLKNGLSHEIDRFGKENERLRRINAQFTEQNDQLELSVDRIEVFSDQLGDEAAAAGTQNVRLKASITRLNDIEEDLVEQLEDLMAYRDSLNGTSQELQDSLDKLGMTQLDFNRTIRRIQRQLQDYEDLRSQLSTSINVTQEQILPIVAETVEFFDKVKELGAQNILLDVFKFALIVEKTDDSAGFTKNEFDTLVERIQEDLNASSTFNDTLFQFPGEPDEIVNATEIYTIIQEYVDSLSDEELVAGFEEEAN